MTTDQLPGFDLHLPRQICFGWGRRAELPSLVLDFGSHAWLVLGSRKLEQAGVVQTIIDQLHQVGIQAQVLARQSGEPTVTQVDQVTAQLRQQIDRVGSAVGHWLLAIGGGSAIDLAKAVAAMLTNAQGSSVVEFLEGIGTGRTIDNAPLPVVAMPTTAGTGSEATKNAVLTSLQPVAKKSLRAASMIPRLVLVDPELTCSVPPQMTAWTGCDALTQLIESYLTRRAQPATRALALAGLQDFFPALTIAVQAGTTRWARERLAQAALYSGIALANSGLGLAHGVAAALGANKQIPHGLACAVMLLPMLRYNRETCQTDYGELARILCAREFRCESEAADCLLLTIQQMLDELQIPRQLCELGVADSDIPLLVSGSQGNSLNGNPKDISPAELTDLLRAML